MLLAALGGSLSVGAVDASAALEFCEAGERQCALLSVPIDRSGAVPGTIKLRIERTKAERAVRPPLFLIAGGPGQSATRAFGPEAVDQMVGSESRSRDIVVMDLRGTGDSGALSCRELQGRHGWYRAESSTCAVRLGARRDFYTSVDAADDIDAVRAALGVERIAILGVSYGTHVALTYARRHPSRVDRLVLDSAVGSGGVDAFERPSMRAAPRVVGAYCGKRRCRGFTRDAAADVARLAARLERRPLAGAITDRAGRRRPARIDGVGLLDTIVASDLNPLLRAEIPGAIRNALRGDPAPLLRAQRRARLAETAPEAPRSLSVAAYAATLCADTRLPWSSATSFAQRDASAAALVAAQPSGTFAPFGPQTALRSDVLETCAGWPSSLRPVQPLGDLPDVPALVLAGGLDARTPVDNARAIASELPRARVITLGNAGHNALSWDFQSCLSSAVRRFLAGGTPGRCKPISRILPPFGALPASLRELSPLGSVRGRAGRTLNAVNLTIFDGLFGLSFEMLNLLAEDTDGDSFLTGRGFRVGALRGGSYVSRRGGRLLLLRRASVVPGVRVSGRIDVGGKRLRGSFRVTGPVAARGRLVLRGIRIRGRLGGRAVRGRLVGLEPLAAVPNGAAVARTASLTRLLTPLG